MVLGTASGVGKSFITAGLCRLFSDWGCRVAPFKAQNMSNNSYVTEGGGEIGRAQAVQAECARVKPTVDMNPVLLKPAADDGSQLVVQGKAAGHFTAREYCEKKTVIQKAIEDSYNRLAAQYDLIIIEGAGSPAEVNLKQYDLVNMAMAEYADAKCVLVADIDRGGVFASVVGTLELLEPHERERIAGLIINKFRGDPSLFTDGVAFIEKRTGKKVWGVLPYDRNLWIEEEDSVSVEKSPAPSLRAPEGRSNLGFEIASVAPLPRNDILDIAVIKLPRLSNFTDFEVLKHEPQVRLRYIQKAEEIGSPDLLILPGTKATMADWLYLIENGFREKILAHVQKGGRVLGVCGGYQMMGDWILDGQGVESSCQKNAGLGFFKMTTEFQSEKVLRRVAEPVDLKFFGQEISGTIEAYEIHMGVTRHEKRYAALGSGGAIHENGKIAGTYYHGLFDSGSFRKSFLNALAKDAGKIPSDAPALSVQAIKEIHYDKLRQMLEQSLDLEALKAAAGLKHPSLRASRIQ